MDFNWDHYQADDLNDLKMELYQNKHIYKTTRSKPANFFLKAHLEIKKFSTTTKKK